MTYSTVFLNRLIRPLFALVAMAGAACKRMLNAIVVAAALFGGLLVPVFAQNSEPGDRPGVWRGSIWLKARSVLHPAMRALRPTGRLLCSIAR